MEIVDDAANKALWAWQELVRHAAQGTVLYNDDTTAKILFLINEQMGGNSGSSRKGMFTSAILSEVVDKKIALFYTGRNHAGENLADVLKKDNRV